MCKYKHLPSIQLVQTVNPYLCLSMLIPRPFESLISAGSQQRHPRLWQLRSQPVRSPKIYQVLLDRCFWCVFWAILEPLRLLPTWGRPTGCLLAKCWAFRSPYRTPLVMVHLFLTSCAWWWEQRLSLNLQNSISIKIIYIYFPWHCSPSISGLD